MPAECNTPNLYTIHDTAVTREPLNYPQPTGPGHICITSVHREVTCPTVAPLRESTQCTVWAEPACRVPSRPRKRSSSCRGEPRYGGHLTGALNQFWNCSAPKPTTSRESHPHTVSRNMVEGTRLKLCCFVGMYNTNMVARQTVVFCWLGGCIVYCTGIPALPAVTTHLTPPCRHSGQSLSARRPLQHAL